MFKDQTAIVGIGQTEFSKNIDSTELNLACKAIKLALDDAGINPDQVDALGSFTYEENPEFEISRNLGFGNLHYWSQAPYGGGASCVGSLLLFFIPFVNFFSCRFFFSFVIFFLLL